MLHVAYSFARDPLLLILKDLEAPYPIRRLSLREILTMPESDLMELQQGLLIDRLGDGWDQDQEESPLDNRSFHGPYARYQAMVQQHSQIGMQMFHLGTPWSPNRLPAQWAYLENQGLPVSVPEYYQQNLPSDLKAQDFIHTHPNNLYKWRTEAKPEGHQGPLYVRRPRGRPLLLAKVFDQVWIKPLGEPVGDRREIVVRPQLMADLQQVFPHQCGEMLLFVEPAHVTFAMFSNYPLLAMQDDRFQALARQTLHTFLSNPSKYKLKGEYR